MPQVSPSSPDLSLELPSPINLSDNRHTRQDKFMYLHRELCVFLYAKTLQLGNKATSNQAPNCSDMTLQQSGSIILHMHYYIASLNPLSKPELF